jgi:WhiB family transcriptional regulator, redox-sensing transcriptional regulator
VWQWRQYFHHCHWHGDDMSWQYLNKGRRSTPRTLPDLRLITGAESMSAFPDGSFPRGNPERQIVPPEREPVGPLKRIAAKRDAWLDGALCRNHPLLTFFPEAGQRAAPALEICGACSVRNECLADAIASGDEAGIRGGMTAGARQLHRVNLERRADGDGDGGG